MRINNLDISYFNMRANSFGYQPMGISRSVFQPDNSIRPTMGKIRIEPKQMTLVAEFKSKLDISNFIAEFIQRKENIIDIEDGFLYKTYLSGVNAGVNEYWQGWYKLSLPVLVIQCGHEQKYTLKKQNTLVSNNGNYCCECIYEIVPHKDIESLTIDKITIRNLKMNQRVIIDGVLKRVYSDSEINKYSDCSFSNHLFPTLDAGVNSIYLSHPEDVSAYLHFEPLFI